MKKLSIILSIISVFLLITLPNISAIEYNEVLNENKLKISKIIESDINSKFDKILNLIDEKAFDTYSDITLFNIIIDIIVFLFTSIFKVIGSIISIAAQIFGSIISTFIQIIVPLFVTILSIFGQIIGWIFGTIGSLIGIIANIIGSIISLIFGTFGKIIGFIFNLIIPNAIALNLK